VLEHNARGLKRERGSPKKKHLQEGKFRKKEKVIVHGAVPSPETKRHPKTGSECLQPWKRKTFTKGWDGQRGEDLPYIRTWLK